MNLAEVLLALLLLLLLSAGQQQFFSASQRTWNLASARQNEFALLQSLEAFACRAAAAPRRVAAYNSTIQIGEHVARCRGSAPPRAAIAAPVQCTLAPELAGMTALHFLCLVP